MRERERENALAYNNLKLILPPKATGTRVGSPTLRVYVEVLHHQCHGTVVEYLKTLQMRKVSLALNIC